MDEFNNQENGDKHRSVRHWACILGFVCVRSSVKPCLHKQFLCDNLPVVFARCAKGGDWDLRLTSKLLAIFMCNLVHTDNCLCEAIFICHK